MSLQLKFTKMHGCGNDYIYFDCLDGEIPFEPGELSRLLADRHFGIGGDGIILICPSDIADAKMRMFNADGSEGKMCGNATRCIVKYLYDRRGLCSDVITVETLSGVKTATVIASPDGVCETVRVHMGKADFTADAVPTVMCEGEACEKPLLVGDTNYTVTAVSVGNPHCVVFMNKDFDLDGFDIAPTGALFEHHQAFPEGVNTEFVRIVGSNTLQMRVWERGSGETLACGTGACASAAAAVKTGRCSSKKPVKVKLIGGELTIYFEDDGIYMEGGADFVFDGTVDASLLRKIKSVI